MLKFQPVTIDDLRLLNPFLMQYGSSSCQHSFPGMMGYKYGDEFCFDDGILYVHRNRKDHDGYRVYLAPLGDLGGDVCASVLKILEDAHSHNALASFETVTGHFKDLVSSRFGGRFDIEYSRDFSEYIHIARNLSELTGRGLAPIRNRVRAFRSTYKGRYRIENIGASNINYVREFTRLWVKEKIASGDDTGVEDEAKSAFIYLDNFERMGFKGIVVFIDDEVVGYAAGLPIAKDTVDEVLEKGLRNVTGIYQLLCNEFVNIYCSDFSFINREEDLGIPGLRRSKESYRPFRMLDKFIVREKRY